MKYIYIILILILSSCGHIKKEYEKQRLNNIDASLVINKDSINFNIKDTIKIDRYIFNADTVNNIHNDKIIIIGTFLDSKNAYKYQKSIDIKNIFTSIKYFDGYYRVIIDTLDLTNKRDSIKLEKYKKVLNVNIKQYNRKT